MQVKITAPDGNSGLVAISDDETLIIAEGEIKLADMLNSLRGIRPNSATGEVNSLNAEAHLVLRSLESAGWRIEWPEVEEATDEPQDEEEAGPDTGGIVN